MHGDTSSGFRDWFGFLYDATEGALNEEASSVEELGKAVQERRDDALDVVKTVTRKRGFESWRTLCEEYRSTTGTWFHEYSNFLEYDFGTTDGFKKSLQKCENQIADCRLPESDR